MTCAENARLIVQKIMNDETLTAAQIVILLMRSSDFNPEGSGIVDPTV